MAQKKKPVAKKVKARKVTDFFTTANRQLSSESLARAEAKARNEIFSIRLAQLREQQGIAQTEIKGFTQSNVSRLEARDDMKVSTLVSYVTSIDMDIEITVRPKHGSHKGLPIKLLKTG